MGAIRANLTHMTPAEKIAYKAAQQAASKKRWYERIKADQVRLNALREKHRITANHLNTLKREKPEDDTLVDKMVALAFKRVDARLTYASG